jgi:hypothetical protein
MLFLRQPETFADGASGYHLITCQSEVRFDEFAIFRIIIYTKDALFVRWHLALLVKRSLRVRDIFRISEKGVGRNYLLCFRAIALGFAFCLIAMMSKQSL